jgi:hypothetical protein
MSTCGVQQSRHADVDIWTLFLERLELWLHPWMRMKIFRKVSNRHKRGKRRRIGCLQISMQKTSKANPNNDLEAKANILSLSPNHALFWMQEMNSNFQIDHQCKSTIMMPPFNSCPTQGTCANFGTQRSNAAVTDCKSKIELVEVL